jgi:bacterial/archaeal transporter family protein
VFALINFVILALVVITQVAGNVFLSKGIKALGAIDTINPLVLFGFGWQIINSPWIWLALVFLIASLIFYLVALSHFELSYILPLIAFNYVLTTFAAWLILGDRVSITRWLGTILITCGVMLVGFFDRKPKKISS